MFSLLLLHCDEELGVHCELELGVHCEEELDGVQVLDDEAGLEDDEDEVQVFSSLDEDETEDEAWLVLMSALTIAGASLSWLE